MLSPIRVVLPFFKVLDSLHLKRTLSQRHRVSKKMCIFAAEIDARKVEQCGKHLYCPKLKFRQKIQRTRYRCLLLFRVCIGLPPLHIVKHRMKFFPVLFWNGVWRCLNFVKQATRVLCFSCILLIAPLRTQGRKSMTNMKKALLALFVTLTALTSLGQSELRKMVPFDIPIGISEREAKNIISRHSDISMQSSEIKNGIKVIEYHDTWIETHGLYLSIEDGYVSDVEWGYQYPYYDEEAYSRYKAIKTYLEETYGTPDYIDETDDGLVYSFRNYTIYYSHYKDKGYGAVLQLFEAKSNSTLLSLFMLAFSKTDSGCGLSIRFCSTAEVRQAINRIKQKEKEQAEQKKNEVFNSMISKARKYAQTGQYKDALGKYQEAITSWPEKSNEYKAEIEKCKQDWDSAIEREKQNRFYSLITDARNKYDSKDFTGALAKYDAAFALYPEKEKLYITEVNKCICRNNCRLGDIELDRHQYSKAREYYNIALQLTSEFEEEIGNKLSNVDKVEKLDYERQRNTYDYQTINNANYINATDRLEELILEYAKLYELQPCTVTVSYRHTISGNETKEIAISPENQSFKSYLTRKAPSLPVCEKYGLKLATTATIQIPVQSVMTKKLIVKRKYNGIETNEPLPTEITSRMTKPGSYDISITTTCINGEYNSFQQLSSYKNTGGPSNALLSVLVPGLGKHKVTYGEESGVVTTVAVYGLIACAVGSYFYSNSEYDRYHQATTRSDMDKHFENAKYTRIMAYSFLGLAAYFWIKDIVEVYLQGEENVKKYENGQAYVSCFPQNNGFGIGYTFNF